MIHRSMPNFFRKDYDLCTIRGPGARSRKRGTGPGISFGRRIMPVVNFCRQNFSESAICWHNMVNRKVIAPAAAVFYMPMRSRWNMMASIMKSAIYVFMTLSALLFFAACSGTADIGEPPPEAVCSSIVDAKCVKCHYKTRICDALGTKSVSNWRRTIKFMLKQGAQLTEEEQNKVIACLSSLPKGSGVVCQ